MVTIYTITYNEELLIQFMIDHYRSRFPGCRIVVFDNYSSDKTAEIAKANKCEVILFESNNQFVDRQNMIIKNSCWQDADTEWVVVCDLDELVDINSSQLKAEEQAGTSIVRFEVYDMVNLEDNLDINSMKYGVKSPIPSKFFLFSKKLIQAMNYSVGAHDANPKGKVIYSKKSYPAYHYNSINPEITIAKLKKRQTRLCQENIENGWGEYVFMTPDEIRQEFAEERKKAVKIR